MCETAFFQCTFKLSKKTCSLYEYSSKACNHQQWELAALVWSSAAAGSPSVRLINQQHPRSRSAAGSSYRRGIDYISESILVSVPPQGERRCVKLKRKHFNAHRGAIFRQIVH